MRLNKIPGQFRHVDTIQVVPYQHTDLHDDLRIVDESSYVPNAQANQILKKQFALSMLDNLAYDDPKDIAADAVNLFARRKDVDIAELSQHSAYLKAKIEKDVEKARRKAARMNEYRQRQLENTEQKHKE